MFLLIFPFHFGASQSSFISIIFFLYFTSFIPFLTPQELFILFYTVWSIQDLMLTCLQKPKAMMRRLWLLEKKPSLYDYLPFLGCHSGSLGITSFHIIRKRRSMEEVSPSFLEKALLCICLSGLPFDLGIFPWQPASCMGNEVRH